MNTTTLVLLCCLALVGVAGAAEAHITYWTPVTGCGEVDVPAVHQDLAGVVGHPECNDHD